MTEFTRVILYCMMLIDYLTMRTRTETLSTLTVRQPPVAGGSLLVTRHSTSVQIKE